MKNRPIRFRPESEELTVESSVNCFSAAVNPHKLILRNSFFPCSQIIFRARRGLQRTRQLGKFWAEIDKAVEFRKEPRALRAV
ncbi:hypothetical protein CEXT_551911 [Caerostris extrusa]|uniref:Uncharacterized protein n=1 Tax=Caerostris extrusa TaxID=172846 RepID=A0AAV4U0X1_CAEEX|nr:hypothetical protein CEXT_551911 [Caerostris extrusa]